MYDGDGNIVRSIDILANREYNYEYEEGRIVRATEAEIELSGDIVTSKAIVNTVKYYYDTEGKMTKKVITPAIGSAQTIYYETSDDNTVVKFSAGGRTVTSHSKTDSFGRKVFDELQLGTDFVSRQFVYHAGKVTAEHKENAKVKSSATTQLVSQIILSNGITLSYGYDDEERITSVVETYTVDGTPVTNTTLYTYDALGQLETETKDGITTKFEYDNYGNITAKGVVDETGEIAEATKISYAYGNDTWRDLLTSYNGQSITYDAQGNPTSYLGSTLTWEKGRQLKSFDGNTYTYNANGIRTSKIVNGIKHEYILDGTKIFRETWNGNTLIPLYDNEDSVCGIIYNNVPYYFLKNLQGDVIAIVDKDAKTVARYSYDAWGKIVSITDKDDDDISYIDSHIANINPFRYRSYYYDEEIGLYYLQSRYYSASVGKFINSDAAEFLVNEENAPILNGFSYCENNPIIHLDSFGNESEYIDSQNSFGISSIAFGKSTIGQMGCGIVAVYNVLHYFSKKVKFSKLISQLRNTPPSFGNMIFVSGLFAFANRLYNRDGRAGLSVFSIITFLKAKFFFVSYSFLITNLWGFRADLSKACIVAYLRKVGTGHYVAGINYGGRDGGYFRFYNDPDMAKSQKMSIVNYVKLLKKNGATPLFFISVNGKKGWW